MTSAAAQPKLDPDEFLVWDRKQVERHHYFHGEIFAMAGASPRHSYLQGEIIGILRQQLRGKGCAVHPPDLRLGIDPKHFVFADASVVCPPIETRPGNTDVILNPRVVVEVLSTSTEAYDRGRKLKGYLALPSLKHYLLVSQHEPLVELYVPQHDGSFRLTMYGAGDHLALGDLATISIDELYAGAWDWPSDERSTEQAASR